MYWICFTVQFCFWCTSEPTLKTCTICSCLFQWLFVCTSQQACDLPLAHFTCPDFQLLLARMLTLTKASPLSLWLKAYKLSSFDNSHHELLHLFIWQIFKKNSDCLAVEEEYNGRSTTQWSSRWYSQLKGPWLFMQHTVLLYQCRSSLRVA